MGELNKSWLREETGGRQCSCCRRALYPTIESIRVKVFYSLIGLFLLLSATTAPVPAADFDLLIRGGRVVDGTGNPWFAADVAVRGDRVVAVGKLLPQGHWTAAKIIDVKGLIVAPGF